MCSYYMSPRSPEDKIENQEELKLNKLQCPLYSETMSFHIKSVFLLVCLFLKTGFLCSPGCLPPPHGSYQVIMSVKC